MKKTTNYNKISGLIKRDALYFRYYIIAAGVGIFFISISSAVLEHFYFRVPGYLVALFCVLYPYQYAHNNEYSGWDDYIKVLPINLKQLINSKYVECGFMFVLMIFFSLIDYLASRTAPEEFLVPVCTLSIVGVVILSAFYPAYLSYGFMSKRFFGTFIILIVVFGALAMLGYNLMVRNHVYGMWVILTIIVSIVLFCISYVISYYFIIRKNHR